MAYQYLAPKVPDRWTGDERRYGQGVIDAMAAIYSWRGNLAVNDLSKAAREQLAKDAADAVDVTAILREHDRQLIDALHAVGVLSVDQLEKLKLILEV